MSTGEGGSKGLTVPKFTSFRPKEPVSKEGTKDDQPQHRDRDARWDPRHHDRKRRSESRHHRVPDPEERPRRRQGHEKDARAPRARSSPAIAGVPGVFTIDTKGDPLSIRYGGIDKSQIPAYYRFGSGRVLGTTGRLVMHRDGPRDQFSLRMPGEGSWAKDRGGLRSKSLRLRGHSVRLRAVPQKPTEDDKDGFISVENPRKRKRGQNDSDSSEDEQPSYRSIEGKAKARLPSDEEYESDTSVRLVDAEEDSPLRWKSIQLGQHTKDHPEDIDSWLELVDHQDALLREKYAIGERATENEEHSFTEIKVSMLESALAHATKPEDRRRVLTRLMREGIKVWSGKVAAKKWSEVLKDEQDNFELWLTHLDFATSNIATFQYDDVKQMLISRLQLVLARVASAQTQDVFDEAAYVFLRATRLMYDAGYKELAVAAWQAILEINFFRPATIESDRSALESFHEFWESEVPRVGEANAQGWFRYVETAGQGDPPEPAMKDADEPSHSRDAYKAWGNVEQMQARKADMPARTLDEGNEDDPFRVVMFSDLEPFLFVIPETVLGDVTHILIDSFLLFLGYPPAFRSSSWVERACNDQFTTSPRQDFDMSMPGQDQNQPVDGEEIQKEPPRFDWEILRASLSAELLFARSGWFGFFKGGGAARRANGEFVVNVARQLVLQAGKEDFALYYLALSYAESPDSIKKTAKGLLKQYPTNIGLYNGYALAEISSGRVDVGGKVLSSATEIAQTSHSNNLELWKTWSWMELEQGKMKQAAKVLCSSVDDGLRKAVDDASISAGSIIRARETLSSYLYECLSTGNITDAAIPAEGLVLLAYLTAEGPLEPMSKSQGNISAAMAVAGAMIDEFRFRKEDRSAALERVLQMAARLLYFNASRGPFRRGHMQSHIVRFIDLFPMNTIFMSLFQWADSRLRLVDETRSLITAKSLTAPWDCVSNRAFAIHHELLRGNVNATAAAFEHALTSDACKTNAWLWTAYIRFCQGHDGLRAKAKSVFYRALRHVPFSKDVMMEAFASLVRGMESDELKAVFNTMTSKDLRVHVDLDDFLAKRRGQAGGTGTRQARV
ncbi:hypothetical protein S7711_07205 [Stachybotrys chartarum IBT 7711]|uniref:DUF1740-domain-containing protein n=1 Tax=Stachybotrys chartarum (strain CBS 109288 / IBT 7711) TaxID=1280523 RepID=A0A084AKJ5_STACB|nr:hypothetical protein S7711_07205 [Stachybotrys chartarum IBT 7711]